MLSKKRRINKNSFQKLFKEGKTAGSRFFTIKILYTGGDLSRFSVVVSSSIEKKAAQRNKFKRRGRNILIKNIDNIKKGVDVAIFLKKEAKELKFDDFERELVFLFEKAGLLSKK